MTIDPPGRLLVGVDAAAAAIELARGAFQPVRPDWWTRFESPRLYFSSRLMPAPLRAFIDFIAAERAGSALSG